MNIKTNIKSKIKPLEIDDTNNEFVYVRSNITEIVEKDPVFGSEHLLYVYDETEYTLPEWNRSVIKSINVKMEEMNKTILQLTELVKSLTEE